MSSGCRRVVKLVVPSGASKISATVVYRRPASGNDFDNVPVCELVIKLILNS